MIWKKSSEKKKSVVMTHESKHVVVEINGREIDLGDVQGDLDLVQVLQAQGIDLDMIPQEMLSTISNTVSNVTAKPSVNAQVKVDCGACHRNVAYGKGSCLYCGHTLELPQTAESAQTVNEVDARYLDKNKIESKNSDSIAQADLNYIDRLKDI